MKIAIIEDENIVAFDIKQVLQKMGHEVIGICKDFQNAINLVEMSRPDLIIMDVNIKGEINGLKTAKIINDSYAIPSLFITGESSESIKKEAIEVGGIAILFKPLDYNDIKRILLEFQNSNL